MITRVLRRLSEDESVYIGSGYFVVHNESGNDVSCQDSRAADVGRTRRLLCRSSNINAASAPRVHNSSWLLPFHSGPAGTPFGAANDEETSVIMTTSSPIQDRPIFQSAFRRSVTLPPRSLSYHEKAGLDPSDSAADILFTHPSARILKFSPPYTVIHSVSTPIPQDLDYPVDTVETLPWASTTETTVASGLLIIEKVQGSTNFLKSGTVTHAILRNSQCWCVDGESKFVLRIKKFQYYRIELPTNSDDDRAKVEELKVLLKKILRFERTPCPFKRGFHVDLPESDITPRRKGRWKRRQSSQVSALIGNISSPISRGRSSSVEATLVDNQFGKDGPEDGSSTNGSEYDEDETHSETDSHEEHGSHSPVIPISASSDDRLDKTKADADEVLHAPEAETRSDDLETGQTITDISGSALEQLHMLSEEPTKGREKDDLHAQRDENMSIKCDNAQMEADIVGSAPEQPKIVPAEPPSAVSCPPKEETKLVPEAELPEAESEAAEVESSIAKAYTKADAEVEVPSISTGDSLEITPGEPSGSDATAPEQALADIGDEELQNRELDEIDTNIAAEPLEMEIDSRPIDTMSIASTSNSFHSFDAPESPTSSRSLSPPHSPPSPTPLAEVSDPLATEGHHAHKREVSELTITPSSPRLGNLSRFTTASPDRPSTSASDPPSTPLLAKSSASDGSWTEVETPSGLLPAQIRHRLKTRRSLSPLPPSPTLFTPSSQQDRSNHLTSTLLQKACSLALGKPIEVAVMLIHILARIAGGATLKDLLNGDLFKKPGHEQEHQLNRSLPDQIDGKGDDDLDEDDFGVPIRGRTRSNEIAKADDETDSLFDLD